MKTTGVSGIPKFGLLDFLGHPTGQEQLEGGEAAGGQVLGPVAQEQRGDGGAQTDRCLWSGSTTRL